MAATQKSTGRKRFKSHFRIYVDDEIALGPGKAELLRHICETGSISESARRMEMSYNRAWLLVRTMNRCFNQPLVTAVRGGDRHGGAQLTKTGRRVLELYRRLESKIESASRLPVQNLLSLLKS